MAWTEITAKKYQRNRGRCANELSDDEWKLIAWIPPETPSSADFFVETDLAILMNP